jgi:HlyD family secretion protein
MAARKSRLPRLLLVGAALAVAAVIAWLMIYTPPVPVDVATVDRGDVEVTVGDDGIARVREVYAVAAPIAGRLFRVDVEPGDRVLAGRTVLGRLAPVDPGFLDQRSRGAAEAHAREAGARLAAARAESLRAASALALAEREHERVASLAERGIAARAALDRARATRDEAQAMLAAARATVEMARNAEAEARAQLAAPLATGGGGTIAVRAPVSGTVLRVMQESEAVVPAGTQLVEIGDPASDLEIVTDLLSTEAVRVRPGARARIEEWGGDRPLAATVRRVEPLGILKISALGVEEQRVNVRLDLVGDPSSWSRLGHGYRVEVKIVTGEARGAVRVPASALFRQGTSWAVFVADAGRARLRPVEVGLMNERHAEVRRGLAPGQSVVLFPSEAVADGVRLTRR